jgi:enamine deaminase RidA (YjgF/YER057c/UK114 family)
MHYSPGVLVEGGQLLFVSGQVGRDVDGNVIADPEAQYVAIFENIKAILERANADFGDLVSLNSYHLSFDGFATFVAVKDRYVLGPTFPAWTGVGVSELALPGLLAEVQCTALIRGGTST